VEPERVVAIKSNNSWGHLGVVLDTEREILVLLNYNETRVNMWLTGQSLGERQATGKPS
jgi:hypothetical protein